MAKNYDTAIIGRPNAQQDPWAKPLASLQGEKDPWRQPPTPGPLTIIGRIQSWIRRHT